MIPSERTRFRDQRFFYRCSSKHQERGDHRNCGDCAGPLSGHAFSRESDRPDHNGSRILDLLRQPLLPWRLSRHMRDLSGGRGFSGYLRSAIHPREWSQRRPLEQRDVPPWSTAQLWCRRHRPKYESYRLPSRGCPGVRNAGARFSLFARDRAARCPGVPDEIRRFPVLSRIGACQATLILTPSDLY
jgi:hypothetical protein